MGIYIENNIYLRYKTSYLNKEVNCTEPKLVLQQGKYSFNIKSN